MVMQLRGRSALVTGAAGGIGAVIVRGLLESGATVTAADIDAEGLARLRADHAQADRDDLLRIEPLDIANADDCGRAVESARRHFGAIDILINNAALGMGVIRDDHMTNLVSINEITPAIWDRFVAINLSGAWYLTHAVIPHMRQAAWGRIINVTTSMFTMLRAKFHPYGPAKAALEAMSAGHAKEFESYGVTVNVVVPGGPADTPMVPEISGLARGDLVAPEKMVPPILWLCSREADAVTGYRYVAAKWDARLNPQRARANAESPIAWPDLAEAPVWPGGKPKE